MEHIGKALIVLGMVITFAGIVIYTFRKIPYIGKLPGDILLKRQNFTFYFPLTTCILVSIILSIVLWLIRKL